LRVFHVAPTRFELGIAVATLGLVLLVDRTIGLR
jgi:hypothetical protein